MIARQILFMITASVAIAVYVGVAIYVITRGPRQTIRWLFGIFCILIAGYYLSYLFLLPGPDVPIFTEAPFPLRWVWVTASISPAVFLHLMSFYWPAAWRRHRRWALAPAYLLATAGTLAALFTDLVVAGPLYRPAPNPTIGPLPGPLMKVSAGIFWLEVFVGVAGVVVAYRTARSRTFRRQVRYLLLPLGFLISGVVVAWIISLSSDRTGRVPRELIDIGLILAAFLFAHAVLQYGSATGRPVAWRSVFYLMLYTVAGLTVAYLCTTLDRFLATYTIYPYPVSTGLLILILAAAGPALHWRVVQRLDRSLFPHAHRQRVSLQRWTEELTGITDPSQFQADLLRATCEELGVQGGYVAWPEADAQPDVLTVTATHGDLPVRLGARLPAPSLPEAEPTLTSTWLLPWQDREWDGVVLLCPLKTDHGRTGILALGEKRDGKPFTRRELAFCNEMARQLSLVRQAMRVRSIREEHLAAVRWQDQRLHQLEREIAASTGQAMAVLKGEVEPPGKAPLEIRILGPMQVFRRGELVGAKEWGNGKVKALLAYLLWKGPPGATRDEIICHLWPDRPVEKATNIFHVMLHRLRRTLEPGLRQARNSRYILYNGNRYCFNFDAPHWLDVTAFQSLLREGDGPSLREAVLLYRGPYLEDTGLDLPPEVEIARRSLERAYVAALRTLIAEGDVPETIPFLERLATVEPADSATQRALVLAYLARGRRDLARRQVARWRRALDELGLEPSQETEVLWEQVEGGRAVGVHRRDAESVEESKHQL